MTGRSELFRAEAYVAWLIEHVPRAREIIADHLGAGYGQQIMRLSLLETPRHLAEQLKCEPNEAYAQLARHVRENFDPALPKLHKKHLRLLLDPRIRARVRRRLGLDRDTVLLDVLFEPVRMKRSLPDKARAQATLDSENVLLLIMKHSAEIELEIPLSDWGAHIWQKDWLAEEGQELLESVTDYHTAAPRELVGVLAAVLDDAAKDVSRSRGDTTFRFDSIAMSYLRQRVLSSALMSATQAGDYAKEAARLNPQLGAVRTLPAYLSWERGSVAEAIAALTEEQEWTIGALVGEEHCDIERIRGTPNPGRKLIAKVEPFDVPVEEPGIFSGLKAFLGGDPNPTESVRDQERGVTLSISCELRDHDGAQPVLRCRGIPRAIAEQLKGALGNLDGSDIRGSNDEPIGERILSTPIGIVSSPRSQLIQTVKQLIPELARSLVLCNVELPAPSESPWKNDLSSALPFKMPTSDGDLEFSADIETLKDEVFAEYANGPRKLRFIESIDNKEVLHENPS